MFIKNAKLLKSHHFTARHLVEDSSWFFIIAKNQWQQKIEFCQRSVGYQSHCWHTQFTMYYISCSCDISMYDPQQCQTSVYFGKLCIMVEISGISNILSKVCWLSEALVGLSDNPVHPTGHY